MAYTVDAYNASSPLGTDGPPSNVAAELRAIKARMDIMQTQINAFAAIGSIVAFASASAPTGYLALPTAPTDVSRATYATLFAVIGTSWGAGNGTTTFGLPFIREGYALLATAGAVGETPGDITTHSHIYQDSYFIEQETAGPAISGKMAIAASTYLGSHSSDVDNNALYYRNGTTGDTGDSDVNKAAGSLLKFFIRYS